MKKSLMLVFVFLFLGSFVSAEIINVPGDYPTIQTAIDNANPYDNIKVAAGTYHESITINKEGITLEGTLGLNGERLSIIDPYIIVSDGNPNTHEDDWTGDSYGVYTRNIGWKPTVFAVEKEGVKYKVSRICQAPDDGDPSQNFKWSYCSDWLSLLRKPTTRTHWSDFSGYGGYINFWWGFHALGSSNSEGNVWMRFENRDNVNNEIIYVPSIDATSAAATILITVNNVAIKDLEVLAVENGIYSRGYNNIVIDNNKLYLGRKKVQILGDNTKITNNVMTDQSYSNDYIRDYIPGPWSPANYDGCSKGDDCIETIGVETLVRKHQYSKTKYGVTADDQNGESSGVWIDGVNVTITDNTFYLVMKAVLPFLCTSRNFIIARNTMTGSSSGAVTMQTPCLSDNSYIYDNVFSNCEMMIRYQDWDGDYDGSRDGEGNNYANLYLYNNRFSNPPERGNFIKFHIYSGGGEVITPGNIWVYHNSFSGGANSIAQSKSTQWSNNIFTGVNFANNILSNYRIFNGDNSNLGLFSYNWQSGLSQLQGNYNHDNGQTSMWNTTEPHNFRVPQVYQDSINATFDISIYNLPWSGDYPDDPYKGYIHPIVSCDDNDGDGYGEGCDLGADCDDNNPDLTIGCNNYPLTDININGKTDIQDIRICMNNFLTQDNYYANCSSLAEPVGSLDLNDVREIVKNI